MLNDKLIFVRNTANLIAFSSALLFCQPAVADDEQPVDYESKVPTYTFSRTLRGQQAELETNPLSLQFRESRQQLSSDPHRPIYHFVNPEGRMGDANGLCHWQDRWHLFYQTRPTGEDRVHWGHAVSDDLIHWRDLPYAIYPQPEYHSYSGSTWVEKDRVIAMYHGTRVGNMVAVSSDPLLLNWNKLTGRPVIPIKSVDGSQLPYRVFDPCIWKRDGVYYALSGWTRSREPDGQPVRADFLFRSNDLVNWEYMHPFVEGDRFTMIGDDGACPYFWPIGNRYILLFFSHISGGQYLLGDYDTDRHKFVATSHGKFNMGATEPGGVHAPSATPDGTGGVIAMFDMNQASPTEGWNENMTLPRRLTLRSRDELRIEPAGNIESLRGKHVRVNTMRLPANQEVVLERIAGNAMEVIASIDLHNCSVFELNVLRSPQKEEFTRIVFYRNRGYRGRSLVSIDSSRSSLLPDVSLRAPETGSISVKSGDLLQLRIFIDKSVVEVFAGDQLCLAVRVYPGRKDSVGVSLRSQGNGASLRSLDAWQMKSIY